MKNRPKRFRIGNPDGSLLLEMSEEDTAQLYRIADASGFTPETTIKRLIQKGWKAMKAEKEGIS